jgi:hypothetical protein
VQLLLAAEALGEATDKVATTTIATLVAAFMEAALEVS